MATLPTPIEEIALALEEGGVKPAQARMLAEGAAARLSMAIWSLMSSSGDTILIYSPKIGDIQYATYKGKIG